MAGSRGSTGQARVGGSAVPTVCIKCSQTRLRGLQHNKHGSMACVPGQRIASTASGQEGATHEHIAGVAVAQRKAGVGNQVGQAVSAAQQALLGVPGARKRGQGRRAMVRRSIVQSTAVPAQDNSLRAKGCSCWAAAQTPHHVAASAAAEQQPHFNCQGIATKQRARCSSGCLTCQSAPRCGQWWP